MAFLFSTALLPNGNPLLFFLRGSTWWAVGEDNNSSPAIVKIFSSTDGGHTFTEMDPGNEIATMGWLDGGLGAHYDGDRTISLLYQEGAFSGDLYLIQFDLDTGTYGARFAHQSIDSRTMPLFAAKLSNGHVVGVLQLQSTAGTPYVMQVWNGASWNAAVDVTANAQALPGFNAAVTSFILNSVPAVADSSDVLHVIFSTTSTDPAWDNRFFYQEALPDGTLQNFQEFPGQSVTPPNLASILTPPPQPEIGPLRWWSSPILMIANGHLYWGIVRDGGAPQIYPSIYVGSPLVNPTWTEMGNLDPGALVAIPGQWPLSYPAVFFQEGDIVASVSRFNPPSSSQAMSLPIAGPSAVLLDGQVDPVQIGQPSFLWFSGNTVFLLTGAVTFEGSTVLAFSAVQIASSNVRVTLRGVKRYRKCRGEKLEICTETPHNDWEGWA